MLDITAAVIPGHSAAGIAIGAPATKLELRGASRMQLRNGLAVYDLGPVRVWIRNGVVDLTLLSPE